MVKIIPNCDVSFTNGAGLWSRDNKYVTNAQSQIGGETVGSPITVDALSSFHIKTNSFNCLVIQWLSLSKHFSIWPAEDVTLLCHMICYCWSVCFRCQILPICACERSVADRFNFFPKSFLVCLIVSTCLSKVQFWDTILYTHSPVCPTARILSVDYKIS